MKLFLALEDNIPVGVIEQIIESVDVYDIVSLFSFMDEGFVIIGITVDINIRTITGKNVITITAEAFGDGVKTSQ